MDTIANKQRAPRNKTIILSPEESQSFQERLVKLSSPTDTHSLVNKTVNQDLFQVLDFLPRGFVDLLILDPPYNLTKDFGTVAFQKRPVEQYAGWVETWLPRLLKVLKPTATVYICGDWLSSSAIHLIAEKYLIIRNRITWEREKGRGAKRNWKNCAEDIWFCTMSDQYVFDLDSVKLKRRVIAPYTDADGKPKDWERGENGDFRLTHPSNLWTDLTVPFWSMPENTDHPTQKPEKLFAKMVLASSKEGQFVFDPFLGSGTTSVVAKKLGRQYLGIEIDTNYCCLAEKRLNLAEYNQSIQGYEEGVFWERNTHSNRRGKKSKLEADSELMLFDDEP